MPNCGCNQKQEEYTHYRDKELVLVRDMLREPNEPRTKYVKRGDLHKYKRFVCARCDDNGYVKDGHCLDCL